MKKVFSQRNPTMLNVILYFFSKRIYNKIKKKVLIKRQVINNLFYTSKNSKTKKSLIIRKENWKSINFPTHIIFRFTAITPAYTKNLYKLPK